MPRYRRYHIGFDRALLLHLSLILLVLALILILPQAVWAANTWTNTGSLSTSRSGHTATLLPNGKVLVVGGYNGSYLTSAELYDPAANGGAGGWSPTKDFSPGRRDHTATLLSNGKVLVAGGYNGYYGYLINADLYDPDTETWSDTGSLAAGRHHHTATLLPNGKVLVVGGYNSSQVDKYLTSAELYDPAGNSGAGAWSATGSLTPGRELHSATMLGNGKVLVAGGYNSAVGLGFLRKADLYDPDTETWSPTGQLAIDRGRDAHTATLLGNGKVLVAGGENLSGYLNSADLYDPVTGAWSASGSLATGRAHHTATALGSGKVLAAGGFGGLFSSESYLPSAELYNPATGTWRATRALSTARGYHTATLLGNGKVLAAAGYNGSRLQSAELYREAITLSPIMLLLGD